MNRRSLLQITIGLAFIVFIASAFASNQAVKAQDCSKVTDEDILHGVEGRLKADSKIGPQMEHINLWVTNRVVIFYGYTDNKGDDYRAQSIALKAACGGPVNINKLLDYVPTPGNDPYNMLRAADGACASGTKPCGDICIPNGDTCNIKSRASAED
jgi:hypothetical protein